jgi:hypothetical protein
MHLMAGAFEKIHLRSGFVSNLCQTNGAECTRIEASSRQ